MTDKERILANIIRNLYGTFLMASTAPHLSDRVRFDLRDPVPGDLVLATSGKVSDWTVGWFVEAMPPEQCGGVIREIGTDRLCNYSNVSFAPIVNLRPSEILESDEYEMEIKVRKAFSKGDEYLYRFGGCEFPSKGKVIIWIREAFGGMGKPSHPFSVEIAYTRKTSVKSILKAMREGGYGTRKFEQATSQPAPADGAKESE